MSCPIIVSKFLGGSCTFGIGIDVGIGTKIGANVKMDVGVLFCKMRQNCGLPNFVPTTLQLLGSFQVFPLLHI
jgi:hypothetical protein